MWQKILTIRLTVPPVPFRPQNERKFSASEFLAVNSLGLIPSVLKTLLLLFIRKIQDQLHKWTLFVLEKVK